MKKMILVLTLLFAYSNADFTTPKEAKRACDSGDTEQCFYLGLVYRNGQFGVKQNSFMAIKLLIKACDGGSTGGCYYLGVKYALGEGVRQSSAKAKALFGKACDLGSNKGYERYAILNNR